MLLKLMPFPQIPHFGSAARLQGQFCRLSGIYYAYPRPLTHALLEQLGVSAQLG